MYPLHSVFQLILFSILIPALTGGGKDINLTTNDANINPISRPRIITARGTRNGKKYLQTATNNHTHCDRFKTQEMLPFVSSN